MTTATQTDLAANLLATNVKVFLEIKSAYDECEADIRAVIDDMCAVCGSDDASEEQKRRALHTIIEALFPSLAADVFDGLKHMRSLPESQAFEMEMDAQEATFAERLKATMESKGWSQEKLAERTGVGQPAISNMLNRQSRPQTRTVLKLAEALDVAPEELWPEISKHAR
jgi:lambda repressor-like predicted transcriptional regulator